MVVGPHVEAQLWYIGDLPEVVLHLSDSITFLIWLKLPSDIATKNKSHMLSVQVWEI